MLGCRRHPMGGRDVMVLNVSLISSFGQTSDEINDLRCRVQCM